ALAHGPARLNGQPHIAGLQRRQAASSILSSFQTAISSAAGGASATGSSGDVDSGSQSWLPLIVSAAQGTGCTSQADSLTRAVAGCIAANQQDQVQAVVCACGDTTLDIAETAASCIVDDASSNGNSSALTYYNAFVNQCITLDLTNSTALASISGVSVTAAVPTTTVLSASSTAGASTIVVGASNATSIAEATGSASSAASSQVVVSETTTTASAASQSATGGGNGAAQVKVAAGALALVAGAVAILA
ncbi:hypothetical protein JCM6882_009258, partial [Rhodosporidiobolus microsporus]